MSDTVNPSSIVHDSTLTRTPNTITLTTPKNFRLDSNINSITLDDRHVVTDMFLTFKDQKRDGNFDYGIFFNVKASASHDAGKKKGDTKKVDHFVGFTINITDGGATYSITPENPIAVTEATP